MKSRDGILSLEDLRRHVEADQIETVVAGFPDLYGRLVGKRFDARHFLDCVAKQGTHACDYLLTVDMEMNPVPGYRLANWDSGYGDLHMVLDLATLRKASWLDKTALVLCDVHGSVTHALLPEAPRSLLRAQVKRALEAGFSARAGSEVEYYIFNESYRKAHRRGYSKLHPAADYIEDYHLLQGTREETLNAAARHHLSRSGVPVECTKGEWGRGQHELNLRFTEVLEMADRHALYKHALKEIADALGISVTFMAKWSADHAGSSCHLHVSLWRDDRNVFAATGNSSGGSDHFRWFLGGWMKQVPDLMAFYAPTVNSYKRFQTGSWAPTRITWARDNRTAGFRVVGQDQSVRIECRIPGADCNPYLTFAAALAAGLHGIEQQIEPPEMFQGNAYEADQAGQVPGTLREAIERLQQSDFARQAFGEEVVQHYVHFFRTELAAFDRAVTDWERFRYFERI